MNDLSETGFQYQAATGQSQQTAQDVLAEIVLITSDTPLGKEISCGPDGKMVSVAAPAMIHGWAQRLWLRTNPMAGLADIIARLGYTQSLVLSQLRCDLPERCEVFVKAVLERAEADRRASGGSRDAHWISRTKTYFVHPPGKPGLALIDIDLKGLPVTARDRVGELDDAASVMAVLEALMPEISGCGRVTRPSTSSAIWNTQTGQKVTGIGGWHVIIRVLDVSDIVRFLTVFHQRCWLTGLGWHALNAIGVPLEYSLIDRSVGSPERLDYEAPPAVAAPYQQDLVKRLPVAQEGPPIDTRTACPPLTVDEEKRYKEMIAASKAAIAPEAARVKQACAKRIAAERSIPEEAAQRVVALWHGGTLDLDFKLPFDKLELRGHTVADVRRNPDKYAGEHMADPFQPELAQNRAALYRRKDGSLWVQSFAHGGSVYELAELVQSVLDDRRDMIKKEFPSLDESEIRQTIDALQRGVLRWFYVLDFRDKVNPKLPHAKFRYLPIGYFMPTPTEIDGCIVTHPLKGEAGGTATIKQTDNVLHVQAGEEVFEVEYRFTDMEELLGTLPAADMAQCFARLVAFHPDLEPLKRKVLRNAVIARAIPAVTKADLNEQIKAEIQKREKARREKQDRDAAAAEAAKAANPDAKPDIPTTDDAVALWLISHHQHNLRYDQTRDRWYLWQGNRWLNVAKARVEDITRSVCRTISAQSKSGCIPALLETKQIRNITYLARTDMRVAIEGEQWDADPWKLNTPGGVVDLKTGKLGPSNRADFMRQITTVTPDFNKPCPIWMKFLKEVTCGDKTKEDYLQRISGYCLTGIMEEEDFFFLWGSGGNGKDTFMGPLQDVLGSYAKTAMHNIFMAPGKNESRHLSGLADLVEGSRLVTASETEKGGRWNIKLIKDITGRNKVKANRMREDPTEFIPQCKLMICGNHKPKIESVDDAIRRRIKLIIFAGKFTANVNNKLKDQLKEEYPQILAWMIKGCTEWKRTGLATPQCVIEATAEYLKSEDTMAQWFNESYVRVDDHTKEVLETDLWNSWVMWTRAANAEIGDIKDFRAWISNVGAEPGYSTERKKLWKGIAAVPAVKANPKVDFTP